MYATCKILQRKNLEECNQFSLWLCVLSCKPKHLGFLLAKGGKVSLPRGCSCLPASLSSSAAYIDLKQVTNTWPWPLWCCLQILEGGEEVSGFFCTLIRGGEELFGSRQSELHFPVDVELKSWSFPSDTPAPFVG